MIERKREEKDEQKELCRWRETKIRERNMVEVEEEGRDRREGGMVEFRYSLYR